MDIIIHTAHRATYDQQHTLKELNDDGIAPTLLVQESEANDYARLKGNRYFDLWVLPPHITKLAPTRDWIIYDMPSQENKVVFFDDDLNFAVRRDDDPTKFRPPQQGDLSRMLRAIDSALDDHPMAGIGAREGGNRNINPWLYNTRIMRVLAFQKNFLRERGITFAPLEVMEDFHVNLQILRAGGDTVVCNRWVSNQAGGSDAPGGCSVYRTRDVQTESAYALAARHPGFVSVTEKATKGAWGGGTRTDVIIQWKKARASYGG